MLSALLRADGGRCGVGVRVRVGVEESGEARDGTPIGLPAWQAHYDVADNTFVQLCGTKEFLVYPPSAAANLHVFPDAHPRARKSQVCVARPDFAHHPGAATLPAPTRFVLSPGEALFIPAFHFHHVVSQTPCVSLNVFACLRMLHVSSARQVLPVLSPLALSGASPHAPPHTPLGTWHTAHGTWHTATLCARETHWK